MRKEIKIGIFALVILFGLYWGISFLKGRDLFKLNRTYYAYYENVSGIQITSPIIIKGITVGSVTRISFKPELSEMVELQLSVKSGYHIPDNTVARIASNGIIGGKAIEFELGDSPDYLSDGATIKAETEASFLDMAGSEFDYFKQRLSAIMRNLDRMLEGINAIVGDDGGSIRTTLENVDDITGTLRNTVQTKADSLGVMIDNLTAFSNMLAANSPALENMVANLEDFSGALAGIDIQGTVAGLNAAIAGLDMALNSTDGTVGMLLNDRALYDSLSEASANLSTLLADIEKNPKRYVHFSLFGRRNK